MSLPAFIELDVSEQTQELRSYFKGLGADISEENAESGLVTDLLKIIDASSICWAELTTDSDLEGVFNSIISLLRYVPPEESDEIVTLFSEKLGGKTPSADKRALTRIKLLTSLFNSLNDTSQHRYHVYCAIIKLAGPIDHLHVVPTELHELKTWFSQWKITTQMVQELLRTLHESFLEAKKSDKATQIMIELLSTYTEEDASQAREDAHKCIVTCLADPHTLLMDHLLGLKPVKFLEGELIHELLSIFVSGKLVDYQQFYKNNTAFVDSLGLSHEDNLKKMRYLTFLHLADWSKELDFNTIQHEMNIEADDVEDFIIDVLRTQAIHAKIDQIQRKVVVSMTTPRTFGRQQWQLLRQNFDQWQANLFAVQKSLQALAKIPAGYAPQQQ